MPARGTAIWALILLFLSAGGWPLSAFGHPGGTDGLGCHHDRQEGGYHCHSGPLDGREFASATEAERALSNGRSGRHTRTSEYDRETYGEWIDADGDCQDTRTEILLDQVRGAVEWETPRECEIESGTWKGPYTGETFRDPSKLHIDHVVPLAEAHKSGAADWPSDKKREFANDPENLLAVEAGANMSKGADGPADWIPPRESFRCDYAKRWKRVKMEWNLEMGYEEKGKIHSILEECN